MRFEQLTTGSTFHAGPREVTEQEIIEFARRYDPQPFHIDGEFAAATSWGGLIASGWMTCGIAMELTVNLILKDSDSIGSPGVEDLRWENPVRPGDRLMLAITVLESRVSASRPMGIVRWRWELTNQANKRVLHLTATSLFDLFAERQSLSEA